MRNWRAFQGIEIRDVFDNTTYEPVEKNTGQFVHYRCVTMYVPDPVAFRATK